MFREEFFARDNASLDEQSLGCRKPSFIIARREILAGRNSLDGVTELIDVDSCRADPETRRKRIHAPFPVRVKDRFVLLADDRAEAVHPTHVMNTVHRESARIIIETRPHEQAAFAFEERRDRRSLPIYRLLIGFGLL